MKRFYLLFLALLSFQTGLIAQHGDLDQTFDGDGLKYFKINEDINKVYAVSTQSNGKIILAGTTRAIETSGNKNAFIARLNKNGSMDSSFGDGGIIEFDYQGRDDYFYDVKVLPDDRIVLVGGASKFESSSGKIITMPLVILTSSSGVFDNTFGVGGVLILTDLTGNNYFKALDFDSNNDFVIGGLHEPLPPNAPENLIVQLNKTGQKNPGFGTNGYAIFGGAQGYKVMPEDIAVIGDDIYLVGNSDQRSPSAMNAVMYKINAQGDFDLSFGELGSLYPGFTGKYRAILANKDNNSFFALGHKKVAEDVDILVNQYFLNGSLNAGFGESGEYLLDFGAEEFGYDMSYTRHGRIAISGAKVRSTTDADPIVAVIRPSGALDALWGDEGTYVSEIDAFSDDFPLTVMEDGRIILSASVPSEVAAGEIAIMRFNSYLDMFFSSKGETCEGSLNGSITLGGLSGTPPYIYSIDSVNFQTDSIFRNLAAGIYTAYVKDQNQTWLIPETIVVDSIGILISHYINGDTLTIVAENGLPPYQYGLNNSPLQADSTFSEWISGNNAARVVDSQGCDVTRLVDVGVGIEEQSAIAPIEVFPNPTHDQLYIRSIRYPITEMIIYDIMGKELMHERGKMDSVDLSTLPNGLYFIKLINKQGLQTRQIIKN